MTFRLEPISDVFDKFHLEGPWPFAPVLHHLKAADPSPFLHDHPWDFTSFVLQGAYRETVRSPEHPHRTLTRWRNAGDAFTVPAATIHTIDRVSEGGCWTLVLAGPAVRETTFWDFRREGPFFRQWDAADWTAYGAGE